jgi:hypothetical protein
MQELTQQLPNEPTLGTSLGDGLFKIRLAVKSKNKGKSGGFRVITYLISKKGKDETVINLLIIYDKSEVQDLTKNELLALCKEVLEI